MPHPHRPTPTRTTDALLADQPGDAADAGDHPPAATLATADTDRTIASRAFTLDVGQDELVTLYTNDEGEPRGWERVMIRSTDWAHTASVGFGVADPTDTLIDAVIGNLQHYPVAFSPPHVIPPDHRVIARVRNRGDRSHTYRVLTTVGAAPARSLGPAVEIGSTVGAAVASSVIASWVLGNLR